MTATAYSRLGGVLLRPVLEGDVQWVYSLDTHPQIIQRFRLGGTTPSPEMHRQFFARGTPVSYLVVDETIGERIGLLYAFGTDFEHRRASLGGVAHPEHHGSGKFFRGAFLFLDYLFASFPIERIYGQSLEFNFEQFVPNSERRLDLSALYEVEAVLREHTYLAGRWWDEYIFAITKEAWTALRQSVHDLIEDDYETEQRSALVVGRHGSSAARGLGGALFDGSVLTTPLAKLRAVRDADLPWVTSLFSEPRNRRALRVPGASAGVGLSTDQVQRLLWEGVLCQFVIEDRANGFPLGLVTGHQAEWNRLAISFHATIEPELVHDIAVSEAVLRFLDYLFATFAIRKLYVEYPEGDQTLAVIEKALGQRGRDVLQREGCLRSWVTIEGRPHDVVIASVLRTTWESSADIGPSRSEPNLPK